MKKSIVSIFLLALFVSACGAPTSGPGMHGMSPGGDMGARHHAAVPEEYANLQSPPSESLDVDAGGGLYTSMCASCHGDDGMGNGPAASALDPAPAPVAHTGSMLSDGYLYWRIAEGGAEFGSAMPGWKSSGNVEIRWRDSWYASAATDGAGWGHPPTV